MTDEKKVERLENRLKEVTSWWRAAEKKLSQKCAETKANQRSIEQLKSENAALRERLEKAVVNGKRFIVEKEIDGREAYVVCRYKVIKSYICTEYTREAAEARLAELKGGEK